MHEYCTRSYKAMHMNPAMFGLSNTKPCAGIQFLHQDNDVVSLPAHILMMWQAHHLRT
jgi:hypothetical protein